MRPRDVQGIEVAVCIACGAATLEFTALERLLGREAAPAPSALGAAPNPGASLSDAPPIPYVPPPSSDPPTSGPPALLDDLPPRDTAPTLELPDTPPPSSASTSSLPPESVRPPRPVDNEPRITGVVFPEDAGHEPALTSSIGQTDTDDFERQLKALAQARRRRNIVYGVAALLAASIVFVSVTGSIAFFQLMKSPATASVAPSAEPTLDDVKPKPAPEIGVVSVEPEADPEPEPEPEPAPPPPKKITLGGLLAKGWNQVESNPSAAAQTFRKAIDMNVKHPEANYGYGYALLEQNDISGAKPYLCTAKAGNDIETTRDVTSLLKQHSLNCP